VQGFKVVSTGSLTASLVHPREVWRSALHLCAAAVLFVHNHPSGDPAPSPEDIDITKRLKETADILGIRVLDHVILGHGRYFSFSDKGML
jgi:DNA repair protein RadC